MSYPVYNTTYNARHEENRWKLLVLDVTFMVLPFLVVCGAFFGISRLIQNSHAHKHPHYHYTNYWPVFIPLAILVWGASWISALATHTRRSWVTQDSDLGATRSSYQTRGLVWYDRNDDPDIDFFGTCADRGELVAKVAFLLWAWPAGIYKFMHGYSKMRVLRKETLAMAKAEQRMLKDHEFAAQLTELHARRDALAKMSQSAEVTQAQVLVVEAINRLMQIPEHIKRDKDRIAAAQIVKEVQTIIKPAHDTLSEHQELMEAEHNEDIRATFQMAPQLLAGPAMAPPAPPPPVAPEREVVHGQIVNNDGHQYGWS